MARVYSGNDGSLTIGGETGSTIALAAKILSWTASVNIAEAEVPPAFGEKWVGGVLTAGRVRGSFRGKVEGEGSGTKPFALDGADWSKFVGRLTLAADDGNSYLQGTANVFNVSLNASRDAGFVEFTAEFSNAGTDFAVTWKETA